jgi:hypothetical protein
MRYVLAATLSILWGLLILAGPAAAAYVVIHFILKFW